MIFFDEYDAWTTGRETAIGSSGPFEPEPDTEPHDQAVATCQVCGRELRFYTLRMEPRPAPPGPSYCQEHDPKWVATEAGAES